MGDVDLSQIRREVRKYLDVEFSDDTRLSEVLASDDISAIILTLEEKIAVKPDRELYLRASTINDLFRIFNGSAGTRELR